MWGAGLGAHAVRKAHNKFLWAHNYLTVCLRLYPSWVGATHVSQSMGVAAPDACFSVSIEVKLSVCLLVPVATRPHWPLLQGLPAAMKANQIIIKQRKIEGRDRE